MCFTERERENKHPPPCRLQELWELTGFKSLTDENLALLNRNKNEVGEGKKSNYISTFEGTALSSVAEDREPAY